MATDSTAAASGKRKYHRRSDEERIAELEAKIADIRAREKAKENRASAVVRDIPKVQKRLQKFAQLAMDHQRPDIANSVTAFVMTLDRFAEKRTEAPPLED